MVSASRDNPLDFSANTPSWCDNDVSHTEGVIDVPDLTLRSALTSDRVNTLLDNASSERGISDLTFAAEAISNLTNTRIRYLLGLSCGHVLGILDRCIMDISREAQANNHNEILDFLSTEIIPNRQLLTKLFLHEEDVMVSVVFSKILFLLNRILHGDFTWNLAANIFDIKTCMAERNAKMDRYHLFLAQLRQQITAIRTEALDDRHAFLGELCGVPA